MLPNSFCEPNVAGKSQPDHPPAHPWGTQRLRWPDRGEGREGRQGPWRPKKTWILGELFAKTPEDHTDLMAPDMKIKCHLESSCHWFGIKRPQVYIKHDYRWCVPCCLAPKQSEGTNVSKFMEDDVNLKWLDPQCKMDLSENRVPNSNPVVENNVFPMVHST